MIIRKPEIPFSELSDSKDELEKYGTVLKLLVEVPVSA